MANRYDALNALAEIRDYLREVLVKQPIPEQIRNDFNLIAAQLGSTSAWAGQWCMNEKEVT